MAARLTGPTGVVLDNAGNLYIADYDDNRIRFVRGASQILSQSIAFPAIADHPVAAPAFQITATATSGLPVSLTSASPSICEVAGNTVTLLHPGTCVVQANQAAELSCMRLQGQWSRRSKPNEDPANDYFSADSNTTLEFYCHSECDFQLR